MQKLEPNHQQELYTFLKQDESLFAFIQEYALDGHAYVSESLGGDVWFSNSFWRVLGYPAVPSRLSLEVFVPHAEAFQEAIRKLPEHKEGISTSTAMPFFHFQSNISLQLNVFKKGLHSKDGALAGYLLALRKMPNHAPELQEDMDVRFVRMVSDYQGIFVLKTNMEGNITYINELYSQYLGIDKANLLGASVMTTVLPGDVEKCMETAMKSVQEPFKFHTVVLKKYLSDGTLVNNLWQFRAILNDKGEVAGTLCIGKDVTEAMRLENDLNIVLSNMSDVLLSVTNEGIVSYVSSRVTEMYGYEVNDVLGESLFKFAHEEDLDIAKKAFEDQIKGVPNQTTEFRVRHKDNSLSWSEVKGSINPSNGEVLLLLRAINERKKAENELKTSLEQFYFVAENTADGVCIIEHGTLIYMSPSHEKVFGYSLAETQAISREHSIFSLLHPEDRSRVHAQLTECTSKQVPSFDYIYRFRHKDGHYIWREDFVSCVYDAEGRVVRYIVIARDINDQKIVESELQEAHALLKRISDQVPGAIYEFKLSNSGEPSFPYASKGFYDLFEMDENEGKADINRIFDRIHPDTFERFFNSIQESKHKLSEWSFDIKLNLPKAGIRWLRGQSKPERTEDGVIWYGYLQDITDKKTIETELSRAQKMLEQTSSVARVGGWEYDLLTGKITWSSVTKEIHELPLDFEPDLKMVLRYWRSKNGKSFFKELGKLTMAGAPSFDLEMLLRTAQNNERWVRAKGEAEFVDGKCVRIFGTLQDIDEQVRAQKAIEESEERLELVLKGSNDAPWDWNAIENQPYYSQRWWDMLGYEYQANPADNSFFNSLLHPEDFAPFYQAVDQAILSGAEGYQFEIRLRHKQGHYVPILSRAYIKRDEQGRATRVSGTHLDLTERKQMEASLLKAKLQAEAASQAKSEFLANMSHEIRTPLNGVIGFTDLMLKTNLDHVQQQYMNTVIQSATLLLDTINDILDFSKIEAGKLELSLDKLDLLESAEQVADMIRYQADKKKLEMKLEIAQDVPRFVKADSVRLKQILVNLLSNAVKFTEHGSVELFISTLERVGRQCKLRFSVVDTGIGIAPHNQEKIFEAFSQEDVSITRKFGGTGLGLTIANKLLGLMGSRLQLQSKTGQGSHFFFDVLVEELSPSLKSELSRTRKLVPGPVTKQLSNSSVKIRLDKLEILVVEDNAINMLLAKTLIRKALPEATITEAKDGREAVERFKESSPNLIFMDIQMPEMNGYEATQAIRSLTNGGNVPIIAVTAGITQSEQEKCLEAGMDGYISKPIIRDSIEKAIEQWLLT